MEYIFSVIFTIFSYFLGVYVGKIYFSDKKRLGQSLQEIETVANMRISEHNERFIRINTSLNELRQHCSQIPKLQSYSSNAFNKISELEKRDKGINNRMDRVSDRVDRINDDINLILDYLNVTRQGELDKDILGWGGSPENAVTVKLVKNK